MRYIPREDNRAADDLIKELRSRRSAVHREAPPGGLAAVAAIEAAAAAEEADAETAAKRLVENAERTAVAQLERVAADLATAVARAPTAAAGAAVTARYRAALQYALSAGEAGTPPSEELICRLNALLLFDDPPAALVSVYRSGSIEGRARSFCAPAEIRLRMEAYVGELAKLAVKVRMI